MELNNIAKYLYEMGYLKELKRAGWGMIGIPDPESVAEHSFRTAVLGYILASMEGVDPLKTAAICLFHDSAETRIGDLHRVAKRYINVKQGEETALSEQVQRLPAAMGEAIRAMIEEYEERSTLEGRIAHDADSLECLIQAREYQSRGYADADDWVNGCYSSLQTETAKQLADTLLQTEPREWWDGLKITR
ncbi:MAG TPA: HD domain-containing protein [Ktedonobacteraceae bacterium]|nr:HD domain-containing protein [Ktedonobacteraceae bacterium]